MVPVAILQKVSFKMPLYRETFPAQRRVLHCNASVTIKLDTPTYVSAGFHETRGPGWPWIAHLSHFPTKMNSTFFVTIVPTCDPPGWGQF